MESSGTVSTQAPEAVDAILALVGLDTCLYTARSRGGRCAVRVDYISDDGWKSATFCLGSEILQQSLNDAALRQQLADAWQHRLSVARAISPVQVGRQFTPPTRH